MDHSWLAFIVISTEVDSLPVLSDPPDTAGAYMVLASSPFVVESLFPADCGFRPDKSVANDRNRTGNQIIPDSVVQIDLTS